eukprot:63211-Chlamydomonas_euryale.AAC.3
MHPMHGVVRCMELSDAWSCPMHGVVRRLQHMIEGVVLIRHHCSPTVLFRRMAGTIDGWNFTTGIYLLTSQV